MKRREKHSLTDARPIGSVCAVKDMEGTVLAVGKVKSMAGNRLQLEPDSGILPLIPYRTLVRLTIPGGEKPPCFGVGRVYLSGSELLEIMDFTDILSFEKRGVFRVPVKGSAEITVEFPQDTPRRVKAAVRNVSMSGILFETGEALNPGQTGSIRFSLERVEFSMRFQVRRREEKGDAVQYGCTFEGVSPQMRDQLCAMLFRAQGRQLHGKR